VTTVEWVDPARGDRPLVTDIWYPAIVSPNPAGEFYLHLAWGIATRDAPADPSGGPYPLVAFSHGYASTRDQSVFFTEHLASHGYVVVAPDHYGNTFYGLDETLSADAFIDRPLDISFVIDRVLEASATQQPPVAGLVDPSRIGMAGHSFGGYTTLLICGAEVDLDQVRAACAGGSDSDCEAVRYAESLYGAGVTWLDLSDGRVSACASMAPGIYDYFLDEGLEPVFAPMAVLGAMQDNTMPYDSETLPIYHAMPAPKYLFSLEHRDHYSFTSIFDIRPFSGHRCGTYAQCPTRDPSHKVVNTFGVSFFGRYLEDDPGYDPYLTPAYYEINFTGKATLESAL
jgi:predicted dienelactone hydrolase